MRARTAATRRRRSGTSSGATAIVGMGFFPEEVDAARGVDLDR